MKHQGRQVASHHYLNNGLAFPSSSLNLSQSKLTGK
jgi:hypothetical protein